MENSSLKKKTLSDYLNSVHPFVLAAIPVCLAFLVYLPSLSNDFITNWDDRQNVMDNEMIHSLSFANLYRIFTEPVVGMYGPLTILSFAIDYFVYQLNPFGYHLSSLLFHLINILLVFHLVWILTHESKSASLISALLFAVHPMNVECVSWIAARNSVLFPTFFLMAVIYYLKYMQSGFKYRNLIATFIFFLLSLLTKSAAITLPFVLLFIDIHMARKFSLKSIVEKISFFFFSILAGLILMHFQFQSGSINAPGVFTFLEKIAIGSYSLMYYLLKFIAPFHLSAFNYYPARIQESIPMVYFFAIVPSIALAFVLAFLIIRKNDWSFGVFFFIVTIFPVLKFIPFGSQMVADRYVYIPYVGLLLIFATVISKLEKLKNYQLLKIVFVCVLVCLCSYSYETFSRTLVWKNSFSLYSDAIEKDPTEASNYFFRAVEYDKMSQLEQSEADYTKAIELKTNYPDAYNNRGVVKAIQKKYPESISDFSNAILLRPNFADAFFNRAAAYYKIGQMEKSCMDLNAASALGNKRAMKMFGKICGK